MKKSVWIFGLLLALVCFALPSLVKSKGKLALGVFTGNNQAQLKADVESLTAKYSARNQALLRKFEQEIACAGVPHWDEASGNIPGVVKDLSGFKACGKLCFKMAKDRLTDSQDAPEAISQVLGPCIIRPCEQGSAEMRECLNNFLHQIQENDNQYRAELAQMLKKTTPVGGISRARENFQKANQRAAEKIAELAMTKTMAAAGTAIELLFIRESLRAIGKVCGHIVGKLVATGSTAAICAAADGPLPIGDIIGAVFAVGGFAWCAYDIYQAQKVLPGELRSTLEHAVRDYRRDMLKQARQTAHNVIQACEKSSQEVINQL